MLLAEDTATIRQLVTLVLARAGAQVEGVENGLLACQKFAADKAAGLPFDVIVLDMQMPELDGYGAARRLRAEGFAGPIIAMTANAMKEARQRCLDSGCTAYVRKPLDVDELIRTVAAGRKAPAPPGGAAATANPTPSPDSQAPYPATSPEPRDVMGELLARLPQQVAQLQSLLAADDLAGLVLLLHQVQGAGGNLGLESLISAAGRAHDAARATDPGRTRREVLALIELIKSVAGYVDNIPKDALNQ